MKKLLILFSILLVLQQAMAQKDITVSIGIPQNSGLAFVKYHIFEVHNHQFYVIERSVANSILDTTSKVPGQDIFKYDTLEKYSVSTENLKKLADLIEHTDSLGQHTARGCDFAMGWPRFTIHTSYKDKTMHGYVANCYREHIYKFADLLNIIYPKGDVLIYNKDEVMRIEENCNLKAEQKN